MDCIICNKPIPSGRLKAIPTTEVCVSCSEVEKVAGFRVITGKSTYSELDIVSQSKFRLLSKLQSRTNSIGKGVSFDGYDYSNRRGKDIFVKKK